MLNLRSPIALVIIGITLVLGLLVGGSGAVITSRADSNALSSDQKAAAIAKQTEKITTDLEASKVDLKTKESTRDATNRQYNAVGGKLDQMLETASVLKQQNSDLQSEYDAMPEAPNLVGQYYSTAETLIEQAGLLYSLQDREGSCSDYNFYTTRNYSTDNIFQQYPGPGTKMKSGSWVTIFYLRNWYSTDLYRYNLC